MSLAVRAMRGGRRRARAASALLPATPPHSLGPGRLGQQAVRSGCRALRGLGFDAHCCSWPSRPTGRLTARGPPGGTRASRASEGWGGPSLPAPLRPRSCQATSFPRRMLSAWVYQAKDSSARKRVAKQTTYGGTVARYHFKYVLMNPSVHPDVREALTREVEHRSIKTGKKISLHARGGLEEPRARKSCRQQLL